MRGMYLALRWMWLPLVIINPYSLQDHGGGYRWGGQQRGGWMACSNIEMTQVRGDFK